MKTLARPTERQRERETHTNRQIQSEMPGIKSTVLKNSIRVQVYNQPWVSAVSRCRW
jgi:hypothetical protein